MIHFVAITGSNYFKLLQPVSGGGHTVQAGFITNFANVPWLVNFVLPCYDHRLRRAAVVHDDLYTTKAVSRLEADKIMMQIMLEDNSGRVLAWLAFAGVRSLGWLRYGAKN
jgi:hypothetical protein